MKRIFLLSVALLLMIVSSTHGQNALFVLHPTVGDTIDRNEKNNYLLFSDFDFGQANEFIILKSNVGFELQAFENNTVVKTIPLSGQQVEQYATNIEKINRYWELQVAQDSLSSESLTSGLEQPTYESLDLDLVSPVDLEKIKGAVEVEWHRQEALERIENIKKGHVF
ncbi:MAG: hypothetical protein JXB49_24225 [Bacteroidales bacterium]|nr:hypothetical protein [Bacteroidales bacterium]